MIPLLLSTAAVTSAHLNALLIWACVPRPSFALLQPYMANGHQAVHLRTRAMAVGKRPPNFTQRWVPRLWFVPYRAASFEWGG